MYPDNFHHPLHFLIPSICLVMILILENITYVKIISRLMYITLFYSLVAIHPVHSYFIDVFETKNNKTWNNNFEKNVAPLPGFIIIDIWCYLRKFRINDHNAKLWWQNYGNKYFSDDQVFVHPYNIPRHSGIIPTE